MPNKPTIEISFTPEFKRNLRGLAKKYPHIRSDVQPIIEQIQHGKFVGDKVQGTGYTIFKESLALSLHGDEPPCCSYEPR